MYKLYQKKNIQPMRPYVPGEDMSGISLSQEDAKLDTLDGGMIAIGVTNPKDRWYVARVALEENYTEVDV